MQTARATSSLHQEIEIGQKEVFTTTLLHQTHKSIPDCKNSIKISFLPDRMNLIPTANPIFVPFRVNSTMRHIFFLSLI
jgi:hypothetical protein